MALLCAFIDESADEKQERYVSVGGVMGLNEQMSVFEFLWMHETHELKEPFHATDCETGRGQFQNWSNQKRVDLMTRLVSLLINQKIWGCAMTVPVSEYLAVFKGSNVSEAMRLCLTSSTIMMGVMANRTNNRIAVVYEQGPFNGQASAAFRELKEIRLWEGRGALYSVSFAPKTTVALQAADLIAREGFKHFDNLGNRPMRKPLERLSKQFILHGLHGDGLAKVKEMGYPNNIEVFAKALIADIDKITATNSVRESK